MTTLEKEKVHHELLERVGEVENEKVGIIDGKNQPLWNPKTKLDQFGSLSLSENNSEDLSTQSIPDGTREPALPGKKKTPMCLVNELARYHKLQPQYVLVEESGPAHQKTFVVCLKLDNEEYIGNGQSIKKAQHAAAQLALETTTYRLPEVKIKPKNATSSPGAKAVTPTVELNALAMKFNITPTYNNLLVSASPELTEFPINGSALPSANIRQGDFRLNHNVPPGQYLNADFQNPMFRQRLPMNQRTFFNRRLAPKIHRVSLTVGKVTVIGEGNSPQAARHDAAQKALAELHKILPQKVADEDLSLVNDIESESGLKSPVSLAHELALKLNQPVEFIVLSETGPPHMRTFVIECKLGNLCSKGEGNCKKLAKKKAAESILEEWKKAHPKCHSSPCDLVVNGKSKQKPKSSFGKKKPKNLVKETAISSTSCTGSKAPDPISQLVQLQQAKKEREPVFTLISEKGLRRQPEFVMQVTVGSVTEIGAGLKKKDAKRAAALKALETLGALKESPNEDIDCAAEIETLNVEKALNGQIVPGLLVIGSTQDKKPTVPAVATPVGNGIRESPTASQPSKAVGSLRPETRLRYLAHVLEYEVEFSDFPKGKRGEYVSLVTLNTNPPQVSHGLGSTLEEAHDNAASNMLQLIAEGALDSDDTNKETSAN